MAIGERIKLARRTAGLSLREVAARAGVSAQAVSKYERGLDRPGSDVLLRLGRALGVGFGFFIRPLTVSTTVVDYRTHKPLAAKERAMIEARVTEWLERYLAIEELTLERGGFGWPAGFPRTVTSSDDAEAAAAALRDGWRLGWDAIANLTNVLEEQGVKVGRLEKTPAGFDACSLYVQGDGEPVIVHRADAPGDRQRFNLAHELAHLALKLPEGAGSEPLADRFAGAFLISEQAVRKELGQHRKSLNLYELGLLKRTYGSSMQAWTHRAKQVGVISPAHASRLQVRIKENGPQEPGEQVMGEEPTRLKRLVYRALGEQLISESRAAELIGLTVGEFRRRLNEDTIGTQNDMRDGCERLD